MDVTVLEYLIFDLDETLYPRESGLMQALSQRINLYMIHKMGMQPEQVAALRRQYWEKYGTTSRGLQLLHGIDVEDYMRFVHDLPLHDYVQPSPELATALAALPQRKVIFTNATADHARAVLGVLGVAGHFEAIYDAFFVGNESKPAGGGYRRLLETLKVPGERCLMVEDTVRNLRPAKALGMVTVLVAPLLGADLEGVDFTIDRIADIDQVVRKVDGRGAS